MTGGQHKKLSGSSAVHYMILLMGI